MQITPTGPGTVEGLPSLRVRKTAVACGYAAQGLGYAAVMTALPTFQDTWGIDDQGVAVILLGTVEWMGWWPEWATLDARSHRMLRP